MSARALLAKEKSDNGRNGCILLTEENKRGRKKGEEEMKEDEDHLTRLPLPE